ncbi:MAG: hypothetical protein JWM27_867 [Gemmatimonadetes bacterium]|nr:hypothetical protein [Gemmatimonadota bacterium]
MSWKNALLDLFGFDPPDEPAKPAGRPSTPRAPGTNGAAAGAKAPAAGHPSQSPRPNAPKRGRRPPPRTSPPSRPPAAPPSNPAASAGLRTGAGDPRANGSHSAPAATESRGRTDAQVLAVMRAAGGGFRRVLFTRNRRVMASLADGGATLRLNGAFATAPDAVLFAVAALFSTRDGRKRNAARDAVRRFIEKIPASPEPPRPQTRRVPSHDRPHVERMRAEFDRVNALHFGGELPVAPFYLSGRMRRRNGHFSARPLEIVISRHLCTHGEAGEAEATVRHEMIHLWQHATGRPVDHGLDFRRMARKLDVHPRATRPVKWRGT